MSRRSSRAQFLYRFIRFEHLVDLFTEKELHFSRPTKWDDPYEARLSHKEFESVYAQCWCRRGASDAMWRIYSPNKLGVRIKTTKIELKKQVEKALSDRSECSSRVSPVKYLKLSELEEQVDRHVKELRYAYKPYKALPSFFLKRTAFRHEAEVRVVFYDPCDNDVRDFRRVAVNPHALVKSVLFDPRLPEELVSVYSFYLKEKLEYRGSVSKSALYKQVKPIPVGEDEVPASRSTS